MTLFLRQATDGQIVPLGVFVDAADGFTAETTLTIANTDIKLVGVGGTLASKNSGGATHLGGGVYSATFDSTDTATAGRLGVFAHVSGARPVTLDCCVLGANVYDSLIESTDSLAVSATLAAASSAALVDAVWDEAAADHGASGTTGALLEILSSAASSSSGSLDTASEPYTSVAEFKKRCDWRAIAQLVSDEGAAVDEADLTSDDNLEAALLDASGTIEMATALGGRYTSAQLSSLTGAAKGALNRLVTRLTICYLYERRPDRGEPPWYYEDVMSTLSALANGDRIFGLSTVIDAQQLDFAQDNMHIIDNIRETTAGQAGAARLFGRRMNRRK